MITNSNPSTTTIIQQSLDDLNADKPKALDRLFGACQIRLSQMVKGMMTKYQRLRRWVEEEDVLNDVEIRLLHALKSIKVKTTREYLGLSATMIRRQLIDLLRKYRHHFEQETPGINNDNGQHPGVINHADSNEGPWEEVELHELVDRLPDDIREVFELIHYDGMTHEEVACHMKVSISTSKHRYHDAKCLLGELLK